MYSNTFHSICNMLLNISEDCRCEMGWKTIHYGITFNTLNTLLSMSELGPSLIKIANNLNKHKKNAIFKVFLKISCSIVTSILFYEARVLHSGYLVLHQPVQRFCITKYNHYFYSKEVSTYCIVL